MRLFVLFLSIAAALTPAAAELRKEHGVLAVAGHLPPAAGGIHKANKIVSGGKVLVTSKKKGATSSCAACGCICAGEPTPDGSDDTTECCTQMGLCWTNDDGTLYDCTCYSPTGDLSCVTCTYA